MAITLPKYLSPVTVDSGNNAVRLYDSAAAWADGVVTAGNHYVLQNETGGLTYAVSEGALANYGANDTWVVDLNASNKVTITNETAAWRINWDYSDATRALAAVLGIDSTSYATWNTGTTAGTYLTADHQHQYGWYATQGVVSEPIDDHREASVEQHRAASGRIYTVKQESYDVRVIQHDYEPTHKLYPTTGYDNQDWTQSFWPTLNAGQRLRYYPDASTETAYFDCVADVDTCKDAKPTRWAPGVGLYGFETRLLGYR